MDNQAQSESHQVGGFLNEMRLIVDSLSRKYLDRFAKSINLSNTTNKQNPLRKSLISYI